MWTCVRFRRQGMNNHARCAKPCTILKRTRVIRKGWETGFELVSRFYLRRNNVITDCIKNLKQCLRISCCFYATKNHLAFTNKFARERAKVGKGSINITIYLADARKTMYISLYTYIPETYRNIHVYVRGWRARTVTGSPTDFDAFAKYGSSKSNSRSRAYV